VSSEAIDTKVDLDAIVDRAFVGDVGIAAGRELLAFTNAVEGGATGGGEPDLTAPRSALLDVVGRDGLVEAAATIAVFNGLVRVADGTGIQLDPGLDAFSLADRARLGIDAFAGAANTVAGTPARPMARSIGELFG
jgi:hypothetical protein